MSGINIPESESTVQVSIIDTTAELHGIPTVGFFGPPLRGLETINVCALAFLITHTNLITGTQRRIVFDLGPPKDWQNDLAGPVVERVRGWGADIQISKYVSDILQENGVPLSTIEGVIWSHAHWDHIGRVSLFPTSVALITGPGVKDAFYPGYPTKKTSCALERDFANRDVVELDFDISSLTLGGFKAIDFFDDGSFYLLSAPGHALGHLNALARTTSVSQPATESTFILMGADSFHHASQLRPNDLNPLPDSIPTQLESFSQYNGFCPGHIFDVIHPSHPCRKNDIPSHYIRDIDANHNSAKTTPYFTIASSSDGKSLAVDLTAGKDTIKGLSRFDADENILVVAAHDRSHFNILQYFPKLANDWKDKGWKEKGRWRFLDDMKKAVDIANGPLA